MAKGFTPPVRRKSAVHPSWLNIGQQHPTEKPQVRRQIGQIDAGQKPASPLLQEGRNPQSPRYLISPPILSRAFCSGAADSALMTHLSPTRYVPPNDDAASTYLSRVALSLNV